MGRRVDGVLGLPRRQRQHARRRGPARRRGRPGLDRGRRPGRAAAGPQHPDRAAGGGEARARDWRLPEHHDADWTALPEFNRDRPADPFRPYGVTVGHQFEWARLVAHLGTVVELPPELAAASGSCTGWRCSAAGHPTGTQASSTPWTGPTGRSSTPGCTG
ncbi:AGE family epimerase/isomerase [Klenkia terrae]|uniref:AGE family epimerase/isomerase n=1 Tax=Klenkia terrae TaxID=1052259 RepID=UPI003622AD54